MKIHNLALDELKDIFRKIYYKLRTGVAILSFGWSFQQLLDILSRREVLHKLLYTDRYLPLSILMPT